MVPVHELPAKAYPATHVRQAPVEAEHVEQDTEQAIKFEVNQRNGKPFCVAEVDPAVQ